MKEALAIVRKAVSRNNIAVELSRYLIKDGTITAGDGRYISCAPVDCDLNFAVPAPEFEKLIDRLPSVERIELNEDGNSVMIRSKKMHGMIRTLAIDAVEYAQPGPVWNSVPPNLLDALKVVRPFISENAVHQFAVSACLGADSIYATTNVSLIKVDCPLIDGAGHLLPVWAIDHVLGRKDDMELDGIQLYPDYMAFHWEDDSWLRTQLINEEFPSVAAQLFTKYVAPTWEISDEWREAFEAVSGLCESAIDVYPNRLVGEKGAGRVEHETPDTPVPAGNEYTRWSIQFLEAVINVATHWQPDKYPNPTEFSAQGVQGFIIGRR